jgi:hypothetical protein
MRLYGLDLSGSGGEPVAASYKHGNERREILE